MVCMGGSVAPAWELLPPSLTPSPANFGPATPPPRRDVYNGSTDT